MRTLRLATVSLAALWGLGCAVGLEAAGVVTAPMNKRGQFEEIQGRYTADIRFGLFEEAKAYVEPDLQPRFIQEIPRFEQIRFSDHQVESIELDGLRTQATVVVRYRGYWLSSPFEREVRVTQRWRRAAPSQQWFVTPDFETLLGPAGS